MILNNVAKFHKVVVKITRLIGTWCSGCCQDHLGMPVGFFCSGFQFNLLLSPYLCFTSFLYLGSYVLGDDA